MEHVAIMKKSWGLTSKILSGEKKIESRWYKLMHCPWNKVKKGEIIYFKDSGEPVSVKAQAGKILQFSDLTPKRVMEILIKYGKDDGINVNDINIYYRRFKDKKYCILVFLKNPKKIKSFKINKKGFGVMSAWLCLDNINNIKK